MLSRAEIERELDRHIALGGEAHGLKAIALAVLYLAKVWEKKAPTV